MSQTATAEVLAAENTTAVAAPRRGRKVTPATEMVLMFERLATDPNVNVEKLERLIAMNQQMLRHQAKAEFDAAFADMQGELPVIGERGEIMVDGVVRSKYAKYEDIQAAIRPILQAHGFSIRHRNLFLSDGRLKIVGILSHRGGHSEEDEFECPADTSGKKNGIQALGSTRSYGQRYTTIALLNLETRGVDDDAQTAEEPPEERQAPAGYRNWLDDLIAVADNGWNPLCAMWNDSKPEYRSHLQATDMSLWNNLKAKAGTRRG